MERLAGFGKMRKYEFAMFCLCVCLTYRAAIVK